MQVNFVGKLLGPEHAKSDQDQNGNLRKRKHEEQKARRGSKFLPPP